MNINKNVKYNGRQNYICKDWNKKFNSLTNTIFHHTHLTYKQIEKAFDCIINLFSIRKMAKLLKISTKTAFTLRHKIMSYLKNIVKSFKLNGVIELDEYYLSINLKGTRKNNNLANINSLHQHLTLYLSNFRGVSTKHLQEYLDLFCFFETS